MNKPTVRSTFAATLGATLALASGAAIAVVPIVGTPPNSVIVTINNSPGQQNDPHVSGDLASYTDQGGFPQIRYYNFATDRHGAISNTYSVQGGTWIWAPDITRATAPAGDAQYFFYRPITLDAAPTEAFIQVAADNFAEVRVNGIVVGTADSADYPLQFNILPLLTVGTNTITIRARNSTCATPCNYQQNPAGVVFGGAITAGSNVVRFASDTTWRVFDADPTVPPGATLLGSAQNVCAYAFPGCPSGATIYGSTAEWFATYGIAFDVLSDVNGPNVVFTRQAFASRSMVFNTATLTLSEVDPAYSPQRLGSAIGGNTIAYVDISNTGDIVAWDLATSTRQVVSTSAAIEQNPNVSPDGTVIVWESCVSSISNCDAYQAVKSSTGSWVVSPTANTPTPEGNPDTDGTTVVYDGDRAGSATGQDIFFRPVAGGPETQLELPGFQRNPSISRGIVTFESVDPVTYNADVYAYVIADNILLQITSSPNENETLNDVTVLDNGDVRVVWAANDIDVVGTTFTPPFINCDSRLDLLVTRDGRAVIPYTGTDTGQGGSGLRLTSLGRINNASGQNAFSVWNLRNSSAQARAVTLTSRVFRPRGANSFQLPLTLAPMTETIVTSPVVAGLAAHSLQEGGRVIDLKVASQVVYSDARTVFDPKKCGIQPNR